MIKINKKEDCCGCKACAQVCPKKCISFFDDSLEGYAYPQVDHSLCIDCHACERVCPMLNSAASRVPMRVLSSYAPDSRIRQSSSSGGIFTLLAQDVISRGGSVFGAVFTGNFRSVRHIEIRDIDSISMLRGSKYIQSDVGNAYVLVRERLKRGIPVLFSGTPCQSHALRLFLGKKYADSSDLLIVDVICHGVPSPETWKSYLKWRIGDKHILGVNFRDKEENGWRSYNVSITIRDNADDGDEDKILKIGECFKTDLYMRSFLSNVNLRPSCYHCPSKCGKSGSDITLGDFWGIMPAPGDEAGISQVLIRTAKGTEVFDSLHINAEIHDYSEVLINNPSESESSIEPLRRAQFWKYYKKNFPKALKMSIPRESNILRLKIGVARILKHILNL